MEKKKFDLEERLIEFTCNMIDVVEALPNSRAGNYIAGQLIQFCHSPAFNYAEVQAAESANDFIHKMSVVLKEIKECRTALRIIYRREMLIEKTVLTKMINEAEELSAIVGKSISTARNNLKNRLAAKK
jgi:four helix bundle protein